MASPVHWAAGALGLAVVLQGCTSLNGPVPVQDAKASRQANIAYINGDVLGPFNAPTADKRQGMTQQAWRDTVVGARLNAADLNYAAYVQALRKERSSYNLSADLAAVVLSGAGAVSGKSTANALAAASAAIVGANGVLNKDVYYNATVEALIAQMDASRTKVRATIEKGLLEGAANYPLTAALGDVGAYEAAGTVDRAIVQMNVSANDAKAKADNELRFVRDQTYVARRADTVSIVSRLSALSDAQALAVYTAMRPHFAERSPTFASNFKALLPDPDAVTAANAKAAVKPLAAMDDRSDAFLKEWDDAITAATGQ